MNRNFFPGLFLNFLLFSFQLLMSEPCGAQTGPERRPEMNIQLTSTAFESGGKIPKKYTCEGDDVSPPLAWSGVPAGAVSLALIVDDPDAPAGTWVHWVHYNLPPTLTGLPEGVPPIRKLANGDFQGQNDFRKIGYNGPCPPGGTHRYFFKLFALDKLVNLEPGATKSQLLKAMEGHILAQGQLEAEYSRQR